MSKDNHTEFDHLPTAAELVEAYMLSKEGDPTSPSYKRVLVRPRLCLGRALLFVFALLAVCVGASFLVYAISFSVALAIIAGIVIFIALVLLFLKPILLWLVRAYQRLAPDKVRCRCRFEPSCSQYMIGAIEKYGAYRGLVRGLRRWSRCKPPNGGFDEP